MDTLAEISAIHRALMKGSIILPPGTRFDAGSEGAVYSLLVREGLMVRDRVRSHGWRYRLTRQGLNAHNALQAGEGPI